MNEEYSHRTHHHRSRARAQFLAKVHRYQVLFLKLWWVLALGGVVGTGIAWAVSRLGPPSYSSVGRMIVSIKLAIPEGSVYSEEMSSFLGTQTALMQSGVVISRARARLAAENPNVEVRPASLRVSVVPRTSIFVLQATGEEPKSTQAFLQACMEEYIAVKKEMRTQTSDTTVAGLTEEVLRLEKELRKCDRELADFQSTNSVEVFQDQGNSTANFLSALNQRLAALKSEYELLRVLTLDQNLQRQQLADVAPMSKGLEGSNSSSSDNSDSDYLKAKQQILLLKAEQQDLGQYLRPKHPKMLAMSEEIARRERLLDIFRQQSAEQLDARKASLALQIETLQGDVKVWDVKALNVSRQSAEYQRLKANSARIQALYDRLLSTMQTLDVNKQASPESVTIMEKASPSFPDRPRLSRQLLIGAAAGFGLSFLLLLLIDRMDDRMGSFSELRELFDEEVLGQIPREKLRGKSKEPRLIQPEDERHAFVEAYRNLRSSLLYMTEAEQRPRTLLVTSSVPSDGKSLTSSNFAITMASAGGHVLLVDAELRKGSLHQRFERQSEPGLYEVLAKGLDWEKAVQPTDFPNLFLLPRGHTTQHAPELFISDVTKTLLKAMEAKFDWVVIDTAPVMAADDVTSLAPHVDGVLFVVRADETSARIARAALDLLYQRRVNVLGLVFNAVRSNSSDYHYYYKYEDYYRPYPGGRSGETVGAGKEVIS